MKTSLFIMDAIPAETDLGALQRKLKLGPGDQWDRVRSLVDQSRPLVAPRVEYRGCLIEKKRADGIVIDGVKLTSSLLRKQLDEVERVFPYVMTIGAALEQMAAETDDHLDKYYLDTIANVTLISARQYFEKQLIARFGLEKISRLGPGSLEAWPISEQKPLFSVIGDVTAAIGVSLTESFLMMPRKSSSGVYFPTETPFFACQLCPRDTCPSRKAPYDRKKAREYGLTSPAGPVALTGKTVLKTEPGAAKIKL